MPMRMQDPTHPGKIIREECLEPLGLTVTAAARALGVTRQPLNNVINGKAGISPEMALRLARAFGSSAEAWLAMQSAWDLAQARRFEHRLRVKRVRAARSPTSQ